MNVPRRVLVFVLAVGVSTGGLLVPALSAAEGSWSAPVSLSTPSREASHSQVGVSANGKTIATVWYGSDGGNSTVQAKTSTDGGHTWTLHNLSAPSHSVGSPQVSVSANGKTIATTWEWRDASDINTVQAKISTDSGRTWTLHNLSAPGQSSDFPSVDVSANGKTIATTWIPQGGKPNSSAAKVSTDGGRTWTPHSLSFRSAQVGVSADGKTIAIPGMRYVGTPRGVERRTVVRAEISTNRGRTWTRRRLSAPGQHSDPAQVGVSAEGRTIASTWQRFNGRNWIAEAKISTNRGRTWTRYNLSKRGRNARGTQVGVSANGRTIATTWTHSNRRNSIAQAKISTNRGRTWTLHNLSTPRRHSDSTSSTGVGVSASGKTIATTWRRHNGNAFVVQAKISTNRGHTWTRYNLSSRRNPANQPDVAVSAYGRTIATTWGQHYRSDKRDIVRARIFTIPTYTPLKGNRTLVRWTASTGATGYRVLINGQTKCTTSASESRCTAKKAYGPRADVKVIALGAATKPPASTARYKKSSKTIVFGTVHFRYKSAKLTKKNKTIVRRKTRALARQGFTKTKVIGYTAKEGAPKRLSRNRAEAVKQVMRIKLRNMGVSMRITTQARGNQNPIANNNTKPGRAENRRATITIR